MQEINEIELRAIFKKMYFNEFDDPNEAFMDFLLDLISKETLLKVITKGKNYYYSIINKYK